MIKVPQMLCRLQESGAAWTEKGWAVATGKEDDMIIYISMVGFRGPSFEHSPEDAVG